MNKIFKVIWNHAAQRFVVASELTKSNGKSSSTTDNRIEPSKALFALGVAGAALLGTTDAMAAMAVAQPQAGASGVTSGTNNDPLYISTPAGNTYGTAVLIGKDVSNKNNGGGSVIIGDSAKGDNLSVVIGRQAQSEGQQDVVIGAGAEQRNTNPESYSTAIGREAIVGENGQFAVAIGYKSFSNNASSTAIGGSANATGSKATAIGYNSMAQKDESVAIGSSANASEAKAMAIGTISCATAAGALTVGYQSKALGERAASFGFFAQAAQVDSIAIGSQSRANVDSSIALGRTTIVNGDYSIAIGRSTHANGTMAVGLGQVARANADNSIAIGNRTNATSTATNSIAMGNASVVSGSNSISIGPDSNVTGNSSTAVGVGNQVYANNAGAFGDPNTIQAGADGSYAFGNDNTISGANTFVLGNNVTVSTSDSVVLGNDSAGATAVPTNDATVGPITYSGFAGNAVDAGEYVSVGAAGDERQIKNVAAGQIKEDSTDAINGSQLYAVAAELGKGFNVTTPDGATNVNILPGQGVQFVNGTLTTAKVTPQANGGASVTFDVDQGTFNATQTGALIANTSDTGVATVADVANAVNSGYWNIGNNADNVDQVSFGDEVRFLNGTNTTVTVAKNGKSRTDVTYDTDFSKLPVANTETTTITNDGGTIKVDVNTGKGAYTPDGKVNTNGNDNKIANISSVVDLVSNAGWNLYQESVTAANKKDLVLAGDNIVFAKGANTTVSVENNGDTTTIKYDVDLSNVNAAVANTSLSVANGKVETPAPADAGKLVNATTVANAINESGWQTTLTDGSVETINPGEKVNYVNSTTTIADVTKDAAGNVNVKFEVNKAALTQDIKADGGKAALEGTTTNRDNFVTAGDVIDTINNVYWTATSDTDGGSFATAAAGHAKSNAEVKAGNTVTFKAGKGLSIKQNGTNFTYAVATGGLSSDTDVNNIGTTLGKAKANEDNGTIATVSDVASAINDAGWVTQTSTGDTVVINPGDVVNYVNGKNTTANITANSKGGVDVSFDVDLPTTTVNGKEVADNINFVDGDTTTVTNTDGNIKVEVKTGTSTVADGKAKPTNPTDTAKVATVGDIVETINNVYHSVSSTAVGGESDYVANGDSKIKAGDTVNYNAGQNIKISGTGNDIVFSTTENVTFKNADVTNNLTVAGDTTVNNFTVTPDSKIDMGGNIISNVSSGVAPTDAVNVKQLHDAIGDATSSLVWKVTDNNNAANVTNVGNQTTVSFNNGEGTSAIVDGTNVTYNVNVDGTSTQITYVDKDGNSLTKNADGTYSKADGSAVDAKDVTGQVSVAFGEVSANTTTGVVSTPDTVEKVASTKDVRDAINGSGFTLTTSNSSTGAVSGTTSELINPGETITIDAGNNINITQSGNKVSVATSMTPTFTTVQVGGNSGPVMSGDANGDVKVAKADGSAAKITNVAPGEVSRTSTDAVNGSQLYAVANGIDNKFGDIHNKINRNNKDLRAGVAGANAAAALPQVFKSGRSMVAASAGTFKGQSAVAVGYSRASDNGKLILKLQGNANSRGDVGGGVGVGYQW
ncbi:autotransporter adhesin [Actinobacillus porcinus]|uniref:Autotransporter adhesin n=2 Tax=Actinobacillus porcinus TaxID=51048 RepID=A0ABY6TJ76_9PAST|nr:YadA-like family protein [Actinobacillus porcinus]VFY92725.1 autotransporter adhesin [Actinobacillus porcinus]VTU07193.1 autotransporter adhesin [Actinobacillus porcinus]